MKRNERTKKEKNTISVLRSYAIFIIRAPWPSHHIYMLSLCGEPPLLTFRWSEVNVSNMLRDRDTSRVHFLSYVSHDCAFFYQAVVLLSIEWKKIVKNLWNLVLVQYKNQSFCQQLRTFEESKKHVSISCREFSIECSEQFFFNRKNPSPRWDLNPRPSVI